MISQFCEPRTIPFADAFPLPSKHSPDTPTFPFRCAFSLSWIFFFCFTPHRNSSSIDAASIFSALSSDRDWSRCPCCATTDSAITYRALIHTVVALLSAIPLSTLSTFLDMQRPLKTPRTERYFFLLSRPHYLLHPFSPPLLSLLARIFIRRWILILPGSEINQLLEFLNWSVIKQDIQRGFLPLSAMNEVSYIAIARRDTFANLISMLRRCKCKENYSMEFFLRNGEV